MEDLPVLSPDEDQEDQKTKKKRRLPSFLSSWLNRETKDVQEEDEASKKPFSERAWSIFQKFFSREAERPDKIEENNESALERPQRFLDFGAVETVEVPHEGEAKQSDPESSEQPEQLSERNAEAAPKDDGELIISHEEDEPEDQPTNYENVRENELPPPMVEPPLVGMQQYVEMIDRTNQEYEASVAPTSQPEKIGDVLDRRLNQDERNFVREKQRNRRRNRRLKKQVRELRNENDDQSKQQETLQKQQTQLKSQVEQLRQQPDVSRLIERQERERAELQTNRGMLFVRPEAKPVERSQPVNKPEAPQPKQAETVRPSFETPPPTSRRVEKVSQPFEVPLVEDTRSEQEFERRHEIKDAAGSPTAAGYAALASADAAYRATAAQMAQAATARSVPPPQSVPISPKPTFQASDIIDSPMYRQAVRNGFLTAVILLAIWLVISIAS